jgi:hypothetical protein
MGGGLDVVAFSVNCKSKSAAVLAPLDLTFAQVKMAPAPLLAPNRRHKADGAVLM